VGGDAFFALHQAHPEYEYSLLVRTSANGALVASEYPKVRLVFGDLDNAALLQEESAKADVVLHTADSSDHEVAAKAIAKGIESGHTKEKPGFWIHLSGTGILCWKDIETQTYGEAPSQPPYDDLENVDALTSLPDTAFHRHVDKIVLAAQSDGIKEVIVCPPTIYGLGRGPANKRSRQVYNLVRITLEDGQPPQLGKGLTEWDNVHIHDLSDLFVLLVKAAVSGNQADPEIWGPKGYLLAENGHHVWGEVSKQVGEEAFKQGYIKNKVPASMDPAAAKEKAGFEALSWGLNSKGYAKRAKKFLGWKTKGKSLEDEIPYIIESEAVRIGLKKGYAEKVSG
jgi:hypothetical protein